MEAAMGESTEDALDSSNIHTSAAACRSDMHLNGEVNGPCGDNVDLCGIISRDIASSKLLSDVGNDSVGGDSNQSVLSNSVGVEENGNVVSSDSDGDDMDVPSDDSSSRIQGGVCLELATEDGMVDDDGSRDGDVMDSEMADADDASVSSPAMEDLEKESSAEMSGIVGVDSYQETDLAAVGDDSRETDTAERDEYDDDSEDTGLAGRDDVEEIGMARGGDDLQESDTESRGGDNVLGTSIVERDEDIQVTGIEERSDLHETGVEGMGDDTQDDGAEGSGDSFQDDDFEGRGDSLQEASVEDKDDSLQEDGVEGRGDSLQESGVEGRDDSLQESGVEGRDDSLQESGVDARDDSLQESGVEARDDSLQESGVEVRDDSCVEARNDSLQESGVEARDDSCVEARNDSLQESGAVESDHLQETDSAGGGDESLRKDIAGKVVSQEAVKPKDSVEDESMEVRDTSAISKPACDSVTKESDEMYKTILKLTKSDCDSRDTAVADSSASKMNSSAVAGENSVSVKLEDACATSSKTDVKLDDTPGKIKKSRKSLSLNVTPRRSSRNLSKSQKTYSEHEEDPDIEEITPQDPLADPLSGEVARDKEPSKPRASRNKTTIVVNDTKRLVEIAAGSKPSKGGKKEPTLVIIDTNSILSGRGPVPVSQSIQPQSSSSASGYSMLPVALPAQGLYPSNITQSASPTMSTPLRTSTPVAAVPQPRPPPQILPSLTDDMYVVEAPSFIVPYVYEKPPIKPLKEYVECLGKELEKLKEEEKASEASNKESEQDDAEKGDVSKESDGDKSVDGKEGERQGQNDKSHSDAPDETTDLLRHAKVTNGEGGDDETHRESSDNNKQARKGDTAELKNELKSSDVNGDVSESKGGSKLEDKEKGDSSKGESSKPTTYFDNPLGKFFMQIGVNLVQEYVQTDLLRSQKKKRDREGGRGASVTQFAISSLLKNLELSKENNEPFHLSLKKCDFCNFKTESALVMAQHLETPHMKNYVYRCNFCTLEVRSPHDILFHMEAEHNVRGRLERAPAFHQCPNCPFEDNQKGKLSRHLISCLKKFKPEKNQEPPLDWEPPAKIPRVSRNRPSSMGIAYQALSAKQVPQHPLLPKLVPSPQSPVGVSSSGRGRGRPPLHSRYLGEMGKIPVQRPIAPTQIRQSMLYRSTASGSPMLVPTTYQISGNQIYQVVGGQGQMMPVMSSGITPMPRIALMSPTSAPSQSVSSSVVSSATPTPVALVPSNAITIQNAHKNNPTAKLLQQPSISITPLPRQPAALTSPSASLKQAATSSGGKATFVICEICDGYIKDLEQLRNHMQWIHKVKIHPKMIYNRPPLNCQKCQFRFFTDQGLERHLLGSHGLVTSSMQEAANKGKDGGRCPVCGRVYQWKLLNHVARDHNMTLKPAHLSYKCTVCTATFGMYKQFENHVYSAHSVVAKRVMDKKTTSPGQQPSRAQGTSGDSLLKPLKINDEITIIPQPARPRPGPASRTGAISAAAQAASNAKVWQCNDCEATFDGPTGFAQFTAHVKRRHLRRCSVRLCRLDACPTCKRRYVTGAVLEWLRDRSGVDVIELSDDEVVIGQGRSEITITKVSCAPGPKRFKQRLQQAKVQVIEIEDSPIKVVASEESGEDSLTAVKERLRRRKSLEISQIDADGLPQAAEDLPSKKRRKIGDD